MSQDDEQHRAPECRSWLDIVREPWVFTQCDPLPTETLMSVAEGRVVDLDLQTLEALHLQRG